MVTSYMPTLAFAMAEEGTDTPEIVTEDTQDTVEKKEEAGTTSLESAEESPLPDGASEVDEPSDVDNEPEVVEEPEIVDESEETDSSEEDVLLIDEGNDPDPERQPEEVNSDQQVTPIKRIETANASAKPDIELADSDELLWN